MYWLFLIRSLVDNHRPQLQIYGARDTSYRLLPVFACLSGGRLLVAVCRFACHWHSFVAFFLCRICLSQSLRNFSVNARQLCLLGHDCYFRLCLLMCLRATCECCCLLYLWVTVVLAISRGQLIDLSLYVYIVLKGSNVNYSQN